MASYEYTVIPAPARGEKTKGARTGIERFAAALASALNEMALDGWEYVRAETLPSEERSGLTGRTTVYHNVLVFRRAIEGEEEIQPIPTEDPIADQPEDDDIPADDNATDPPVRAPFSQPMRAMPRPVQRPTEPPLTAPEPVMPSGPRLGPASR